MNEHADGLAHSEVLAGAAEQSYNAQIERGPETQGVYSTDTRAPTHRAQAQGTQAGAESKCEESRPYCMITADDVDDA